MAIDGGMVKEDMDTYTMEYYWGIKKNNNVICSNMETTRLSY